MYLFAIFEYNATYNLKNLLFPMKTEAEINNDILKITLIIQEKFPELTKYISEMPVTLPDCQHPSINYKHLEEYYQSLFELVKNYNDSENIIESNL